MQEQARERERERERGTGQVAQDEGHLLPRPAGNSRTEAEAQKRSNTLGYKHTITRQTAVTLARDTQLKCVQSCFHLMTFGSFTHQPALCVSLSCMLFCVFCHPAWRVSLCSMSICVFVSICLACRKVSDHVVSCCVALSTLGCTEQPPRLVMEQTCSEHQTDL